MNTKLTYKMRNKFISYGRISCERYFSYLLRVPANDTPLPRLTLLF